MPDYEHHVFVSYRRSDEDWVRWTRENFVRPLRTLLRPALGNIHIFADEQIETGASWPLRLAIALGRSRLMIPVLSRDYFISHWCQLEITLMYQREQELGFRTAEKPDGLILPVVIDDGDSFPSEVRAMQAEKIHGFANPFMRIDSPRQEMFAEWIRIWCPTIERSLMNVPPFDARWTDLAQNRFEERFRMQIQTQTTLPRLAPAVMP